MISMSNVECRMLFAKHDATNAGNPGFSPKGCVCRIRSTVVLLSVHRSSTVHGTSAEKRNKGDRGNFSASCTVTLTHLSNLIAYWAFFAHRRSPPVYRKIYLKAIETFRASSLCYTQHSRRNDHA